MGSRVLLPTGSFPTPWFKGGESDEVEVEGVRVGRQGLLPLDLSWKTLLLDRGIMTWSISWKSLDKGRHESKLDIREEEDRGRRRDKFVMSRRQSKPVAAKMLRRFGSSSRKLGRTT
nr:hypothetical protein [Tanacetum cinerariifolium]